MSEYLITLTPTGKFFFGGDMTFLREKINENEDKELESFNEKFSSYIIHSNHLPQQTSLLGMLRFYLLSNNNECFDKKDMKITSPERAAQLIGSHSFDMEKDDNYGVIENISPCCIQVSIDNGEWETMIPAGFDWGVNVKFNNKPKAIFNNIEMSIPELENFEYKKGLKKGFVTENSKELFSYDDIFEEDTRIGITKSTSGKHDSSQDNAFYKQINYRFRVKENKKENKKEEDLRSLKFRFAFTATLTEETSDNKKLNLPSDIVTLGADSSTFILNIKRTNDENGNKAEKDDNQVETEKESIAKVTLLSDSFIPEDALQFVKFAMCETVPFRYLKTVVKENNSASDYIHIKRSQTKTMLYKRGAVFFFDNTEKKQEFTKRMEIKKFTTIGYNIYKPKQIQK